MKQRKKAGHSKRNQKTYNVFEYTTLLIKHANIRATTQQAAIEMVRKSGPDLSHLFLLENPVDGVEYTELDAMITGWLVDRVGDKEYRNSNFYTPSGKRIQADAWICEEAIDAIPAMIRTLRKALEHLETSEKRDKTIIRQIRKILKKALNK